MSEEELGFLQEKIAQSRNFAIYRFPNEKVAKMITTENPIKLQEIEELRAHSSAFVFAPFSTRNNPIIVLQPDECEEFPIPNLHFLTKKDFQKTPKSNVSTSYARDFQKFHAEVEHTFRKLVLARTEERQVHPDAARLFAEACLTYPNAMVYLFKTDATGMWLGATPEILLEGQNGEMRTIALAGTMQNGNETPLLWSEKNKQEQAIVANYLRQCILKHTEIEAENGPYTHENAHLAHLRTDLRFNISPEKIVNVIAELHPTPAVCGLPKEEAIDFILRNESRQRTYYSGFLGWYEPNGDTRLYVNLRCMRWTGRNTVQLMAGGGILPESELEQEWRETADKMQSIKRLSAFR